MLVYLWQASDMWHSDIVLVHYSKLSAPPFDIFFLIFSHLLFFGICDQVEVFVRSKGMRTLAISNKQFTPKSIYISFLDPSSSPYLPWTSNEVKGPGDIFGHVGPPASGDAPKKLIMHQCKSTQVKVQGQSALWCKSCTKLAESLHGIF